jgi:periplasmic protein TonB
MLTRTRLPLFFLLLVATCAVTHADSTDTDRARDGLNGPVRRVRTETAKVLVKDGKIVEGPRVLLETATYDVKGAKIDNAYYLAAGGALTGKEMYKYDDKGNIIEMTLLNADGSIMSKEVYQYEFDAMGNWTKMITAVAIIENSKLSYEPTEITYRSISYYLEDAVAKKLQPGTPQPSAATQPAANNTVPAQPISVVKTAATAPSPAPSSAKHNDNTPAPLLPKAAVSTSGNVTLSAPANAGNAGAGSMTAVVKVDDAPPPPNNAPKAPVKPMSGGVLNGRALSLPVPDYPMAARNAHAVGLVTVEVVVDVTGRVISAHAMSGPVSLRNAAEQAALRARFSPTLLSGQPVKVVGVINYNFSL